MKTGYTIISIKYTVIQKWQPAYKNDFFTSPLMPCHFCIHGCKWNPTYSLFRCALWAQCLNSNTLGKTRNITANNKTHTRKTHLCACTVCSHVHMEDLISLGSSEKQNLKRVLNDQIIREFFYSGKNRLQTVTCVMVRSYCAGDWDCHLSVLQ